LETISEPKFSEFDIAQLTDMGFTVPQAKKALKETSNNMERAVDWLFSHSGDSGYVEMETTEGGSSNPSVGNLALFRIRYPASELRTLCFHLASRIISQLRPLCSIYQESVSLSNDSEGWVLFNDNKVVLVPDYKQYAKEGYIYVYRRQ
jgi:ubiquitin carboxyl-terminal hydrolase 5/13